MAFKTTVRGTKRERELFSEVNRHYDMAREDLEARYPDFDLKDELFRSYIEESGWPYSAQIFVPHTFTALFEKMARLNGGKPRGRLIPREGADVMKAKINNELLNFQWDEVSRIGDPMSARYAMMDLNARKYGASFAIVKWRYETSSDGTVKFNGPELKVLNNRDCLPNPAYSYIKNWFQYREYLTLNEMESINDSVGKPKYKNLKVLRESIIEQARSNTRGGDTRQVHYMPKSRSMSGLSDYLGLDEAPEFQILEVVTELRDERKIVFSPTHGVILQDEVNPYNHKQIPAIVLKYIPVDDDIYGLSEIEPVEKLQKAMNALTSQYVDAVNMDLYRILKVRTAGVQMHTLEWGPGKIWRMNDPTDVVPLEQSGTMASQFVNTYSLLVSMFKEAMGETSAAFSTLQPGASQKTATEINQLEQTKSVRDNFNQIFLSEAIKRQMQLWCLMNKQFIFSNPEMETMAIRVSGRDAMSEFKALGLDVMLPDTSTEEMYSQDIMMTENMGDPTYEPQLEQTPMYPVNVGGEIKPKFDMDPSGEMGMLYMVPDDVSGNYDYIADVEPMQVNSSAQERQGLIQAISLLLNPAVGQMLMQEGKRPKIAELLIDLFDRQGMKGSEKYFETAEVPVDVGGAGNMPQGGGPIGPQEAPGMGNPEGMAQFQGNTLMGGSQG